MQAVTDGKVETPEVAGRSDEKVLTDWRQFAIKEGVAPNKIDQYLLERGDVPEEVKTLIRQHLDNEGAVSAEVAAGIPPKEGESVQPGAPVEASKELSGEVGMLDSKSQIEQIKGEVLTEKDRTEMAAVKEGTQEVGEQQAVQEVQAQTSEQKERTATQGTHDTGTGVSGRTSLGVQGYAVSQEVANSADQIAEKGSVQDAKTWQAVLLQRFMEIWGSFKGLFSETAS